MTEKKKICFVVSSILTARFFLEHHIKILATKYDIYLVGNFSEEDKRSISHFNLKEIESVKIERKINLIKDLKSVISLASYFKKKQFDAIHSLAPKAGLISAISGKIVGTKNRIHIFTGQVWHTKKGIFKVILKQLDKLIVLLTTKTLVDSHSQREYLINEGIINYKNSIVLGNGSISGVNLEKFYPNLNMKKQLREELNIPKDVIVYLFMGRINKDKGIFDLANAFKKVLRTNKNIFLLIVGYDEGDCIDEVTRIISSKNHFKYFGSTREPQKIIQIGDVFCLPSYREGFGTSIIEASSCGLGVICSDTYGLRDTIIDNKTGLRYKTGNVQELTKKMQTLSSNIDLVRYFGEKGIDYVVTSFSASFVSNEWLKFYSNLLN